MADALGRTLRWGQRSFTLWRFTVYEQKRKIRLQGWGHSEGLGARVEAGLRNILIRIIYLKCVRCALHQFKIRPFLQLALEIWREVIIEPIKEKLVAEILIEIRRLVSTLTSLKLQLNAHALGVVNRGLNLQHQIGDSTLRVSSQEWQLTNLCTQTNVLNLVDDLLDNVDDVMNFRNNHNWSDCE